MARKIQHKRGSKTSLPELADAELAYTLDTSEVFIGSPEGNIQLAKIDDVPAESANKDVLDKLTDEEGQLNYNGSVVGAVQTVNNQSPGLDGNVDIDIPDHFETTDGAQEKVNALAGEGNTKTVKQVDDDLAVHKADNVLQLDSKLDKSGGTIAGALTVNNISDDAGLSTVLPMLVLNPNQSVDIIMPLYFSGGVEICVQSYYYLENHTGLLEKKMNVGYAVWGIYTNEGYYTNVGKSMKDAFRISNIHHNIESDYPCITVSNLTDESVAIVITVKLKNNNKDHPIGTIGLSEPHTRNIAHDEVINSLLNTSHFGNGSPEGIVTASVGAIYIREDGTTSSTMYIKESGIGNTGWVAK